MPSKSKKVSDSDKTAKPAVKIARVKKIVEDKDSPKSAKKKSNTVKKKSTEPNILKTKAVERTSSEVGSIAPPSGHLVSAFDLLKRKSGAFSTHTPTVTRLAPNSGFKTPPSLSPQAKPATPSQVAPVQPKAPQKKEPPVQAPVVSTPPPHPSQDVD